MTLPSITMRAEVASDTLFAFVKHARGQRQHVYGVFNGDILVHWSVSRAAARRLANASWIDLRVQHIGSTAP